MRGSVFYKLKSAKSFDVVDFDGDSVTVGRLKELIAGRMKLVCKDYDIKISNVQTDESYQDDFVTVPGGSSLIVERVPLEDKWRDRPDFVRNMQWKEQRAELEQDLDRLTRAAARAGGVGKTVSEGPKTEEERIAMMRSDAEEVYNATKITGHLASRRGFGGGGGGKGAWKGKGQGSMAWKGGKGSAPPATRFILPTGIPSALLVECEESDPRARYKDRAGRILRLKEDARTKALLAESGVSKRPQGEDVPEDLRCPLCNCLFSDAVLAGCCGESYCSDCLYKHLDESERRCPSCREQVSTDMVLPAGRLRGLCESHEQELTEKAREEAEAAAVQASAPTSPPAAAQPPERSPVVNLDAKPSLLSLRIPTREEFEAMRISQLAERERLAEQQLQARTQRRSAAYARIKQQDVADLDARIAAAEKAEEEAVRELERVQAAAASAADGHRRNSSSRKDSPGSRNRGRDRDRDRGRARKEPERRRRRASESSEVPQRSHKEKERVRRRSESSAEQRSHKEKERVRRRRQASESSAEQQRGSADRAARRRRSNKPSRRGDDCTRPKSSRKGGRSRQLSGSDDEPQKRKKRRRNREVEFLSAADLEPEPAGLDAMDAAMAEVQAHADARRRVQRVTAVVAAAAADAKAHRRHPIDEGARTRRPRR
eukprot:TRINITY_DN9344_c1_g1_i2.p1 TRINITY_DN9344_c1_g1~~TRINITY_DN9344_c1_g1_i2.p1  ORF type:complete len:660 (+),score=178.39 TRINITY_DN9344_c1_g1_i2:57-2036(+)